MKRFIVSGRSKCRLAVEQEIIAGTLNLLVGASIARVALRAPAVGARARAQGRWRVLDDAALAGVRGAGPVRRFPSFKALKRAMGPAGEGKNWHQFVEQTRANVARFGPEAVHNTTNVIIVDAQIHRQISAFYSSTRHFTEGMTVRQWLSKQSFEAQRLFGIEKLRDFGAIP
jgi:hypothetical protein